MLVAPRATSSTRKATASKAPARTASKVPARRAVPVSVQAAGDQPKPVIRAIGAAKVATKDGTTRLRLPLVGAVTVPPPDHLVWYGAIAAMTALEIVEWPLALLLGAGKLLADNRSNRVLQSFGEALEDAG